MVHRKLKCNLKKQMNHRDTVPSFLKNTNTFKRIFFTHRGYIGKFRYIKFRYGKFDRRAITLITITAS